MAPAGFFASMKRPQPYTPTPDDFDEDVEDFESEVPEADLELAEEIIADQATAARTIEELEAEIETLTRLENLALLVRRSGTDRKWEQLSSLLQNNAEIVDPPRRSLSAAR